MLICATRAHRHPPTHTHTLARTDTHPPTLTHSHQKERAVRRQIHEFVAHGRREQMLVRLAPFFHVVHSEHPSCMRHALVFGNQCTYVQFKRSAARTILNRTALRSLALWRAVRVCCGRDAGRVGCRAVSCTPCSSACHGIASAHVLRRRWPWGQDGTLCWCSTHHPSWQQLHSTQQLVSTPSCHECCGGDDTLSA
jgi:hypothetical protein